MALSLPHRCKAHLLRHDCSHYSAMIETGSHPQPHLISSPSSCAARVQTVLIRIPCHHPDGSVQYNPLSLVTVDRQAFLLEAAAAVSSTCPPGDLPRDEDATAINVEGGSAY